jgi:hypothetical protein
MMALVRETLKMRKAHPYLVTNLPEISHLDEANTVIGVKRGHEYLAVFHMGDRQWTDDNALYGIYVGDTLGGKARQLFNSQAQVCACVCVCVCVCVFICMYVWVIDSGLMTMLSMVCVCVCVCVYIYIYIYGRHTGGQGKAAV